uniref:Uncharacterized protein n=1 Tax=Glossina brevipalpis TaxID=37001 RepID=A0A1A9WH86_9MUSC
MKNATLRLPSNSPFHIFAFKGSDYLQITASDSGYLQVALFIYLPSGSGYLQVALFISLTSGSGYLQVALFIYLPPGSNYLQVALQISVKFFFQVHTRKQHEIGTYSKC